MEMHMKRAQNGELGANERADRSDCLHCMLVLNVSHTPVIVSRVFDCGSFVHVRSYSSNRIRSLLAALCTIHYQVCALAVAQFHIIDSTR